MLDRPNLEVTVGLRVEGTNGMNEAHGRASNYLFDPNGVIETQPHVGSREWFALRLVWWALLTVVLALLVIVVTQIERPMVRLPAGLGRPGPWSPLLLLTGLVVASVGLTRLAIAGFAPGGRPPGLVLAACAVGMAAILFTGRASAEATQPQPQRLPPDLPQEPASTPVG